MPRRRWAVAAAASAAGADEDVGGGGGDDDDDATPAGGGANAGPSGPMVMPGTYRVRLALRVDGKLTPVGGRRVQRGPGRTRATASGRTRGVCRVPPADRPAAASVARDVAGTQRSGQPARSCAGHRSDAGGSGAAGRRGRRSPSGCAISAPSCPAIWCSAPRTSPCRPRFSRLQRVISGTWKNTLAPTPRPTEYASRARRCGVSAQAAGGPR